jgi:hypothetical protein
VKIELIGIVSIVVAKAKCRGLLNLEYIIFKGR